MDYLSCFQSKLSLFTIFISMHDTSWHSGDVTQAKCMVVCRLLKHMLPRITPPNIIFISMHDTAWHSGDVTQAKCMVVCRLLKHMLPRILVASSITPPNIIFLLILDTRITNASRDLNFLVLRPQTLGGGGKKYDRY